MAHLLRISVQKLAFSEIAVCVSVIVKPTVGLLTGIFGKLASACLPDAGEISYSYTVHVDGKRGRVSVIKASCELHIPKNKAVGRAEVRKEVLDHFCVCITNQVSSFFVFFLMKLLWHW